MRSLSWISQESLTIRQLSSISDFLRHNLLVGLFSKIPMWLWCQYIVFKDVTNFDNFSFFFFCFKGTERICNYYRRVSDLRCNCNVKIAFASISKIVWIGFRHVQTILSIYHCKSTLRFTFWSIHVQTIFCSNQFKDHIEGCFYCCRIWFAFFLIL